MRQTLYFILLLPLGLFAQDQKSLIREGNLMYQDHKYAEADSLYRLSLEGDETHYESSFNLGDALYRQEKYADAAKQFESLAKTTEDPKQQSQAYHNLGNSYLKSQKVKEAIDAYKNALRIDPSNQETRKNLAMAKLIEQQEQQQEQQDQKENQDENENEDQEQDKNENEDQKENENQNENDDGEQEQESEQQQQQKQQDQGENGNEDQKENQNENDGGEQEQQDDQQEQQDQKENQNENDGDQKEQEAQAQPMQGISKEDAKRMLEALKEKEGTLQKALQQGKGKKQSSNKKIEKDW